MYYESEIHRIIDRLGRGTSHCLRAPVVVTWEWMLEDPMVTTFVISSTERMRPTGRWWTPSSPVYRGGIDGDVPHTLYLQQSYDGSTSVAARFPWPNRCSTPNTNRLQKRCSTRHLRRWSMRRLRQWPRRHGDHTGSRCEARQGQAGEPLLHDITLGVPSTTNWPMRWLPTPRTTSKPASD